MLDHGRDPCRAIIMCWTREEIPQSPWNVSVEAAGSYAPFVFVLGDAIEYSQGYPNMLKEAIPGTHITMASVVGGLSSSVAPSALVAHCHHAFVSLSVRMSAHEFYPKTALVSCCQHRGISESQDFLTTMCPTHSLVRRSMSLCKIVIGNHPRPPSLP